MSGPAETVISQLETMHDLTPLFSVQFQVAFLQGRPTTVQARTPKSMETSADLATMLQDIETYRQRMAEGQAATLKALGQRLAVLYRERAKARRRALQSLASEALGERANEWLTTPEYSQPSPIQDVERTHSFNWNMEWLERHKRTQKPKREYAWRAG
jgi:hypothetical protein